MQGGINSRPVRYNPEVDAELKNDLEAKLSKLRSKLRRFESELVLLSRQVEDMAGGAPPNSSDAGIVRQSQSASTSGSTKTKTTSPKRFKDLYGALAEFGPVPDSVLDEMKHLW